MIIDFHTHAFSEKIAERAMSKLTATSGIKPYTDGTVNDLLKKMKNSGVDKSVVLPIATKPTQQRIVNSWAKEIMSDKIYPFGSVHPDAEDALDELDRIKESGLYGVKLHPDYQNFFADDEKVFPIYQKCSELGLMIVFHGGYDPLSPNEIHGTPKAFAEIHKNFPNLTMILAHLGGMYCWKQVECIIAGTDGNIYLDVSCIAGEIGMGILKRIIEKHGADRILFASDCPWDNPANEIKMIEELDICSEDKEKIFYKNAVKLLGIKF